MIKKVLGGIATSVVLTGSLVAVSGTPALADTTCATGSVCFWPQTNFGGTKGSVSGAPTACRANLGNKKSMKNRTTFVVSIFSGPQCTGTQIFVGSNTNDPDTDIFFQSFRRS